MSERTTASSDRHPLSDSTPVTEAILAHRRAVDLDEACFNDDGDLIVGTEADSDARLATCNGLLRQIVNAPCRDHADVQAKVDYLLNGTVGERPSNYDAIIGLDEDNVNLAEDDGPLKTFLRSLILPAVEARA